MPAWQLLGGAARDRVKTYNTRGGPSYGRPTRGGLVIVVGLGSVIAFLSRAVARPPNGVPVLVRAKPDRIWC
ncbi:MAG: hypothetical protein ACRDJW_20260 [Thermomicrobiales bacterium]